MYVSVYALAINAALAGGVAAFFNYRYAVAKRAFKKLLASHEKAIEVIGMADKTLTRASRTLVIISEIANAPLEDSERIRLIREELPRIEPLTAEQVAELRKKGKL